MYSINLPTSVRNFFDQSIDEVFEWMSDYNMRAHNARVVLQMAYPDDTVEDIYNDDDSRDQLLSLLEDNGLELLDDGYTFDIFEFDMDHPYDYINEYSEVE